ncbi:hypothetical protein ILUMI_06472, partial [Ignelater luminosus]
ALIPITKSTAQAGVPTVIIVQWAKFDSDAFQFVDLVKSGSICLDVLLNEDDNLTVNGLYIISDMKGFSLKYLKQITPTLSKKVMLLLQSAYPLRLKGVGFLNTLPVHDALINMFTPFFNEKLTKRLTVLTEDKTEKMYEIIPQEVFPDEYGGKAGPISKIYGEYRATLDKYKDWFTDDEQYGADESKRPGKPKTSVDVFGMEDCNGKLNID